MTAAYAVAELLGGGISKSELSALSGVSRALIDDYLKGRWQPSVAQLARLGESVGYRLDVAWRDGSADRRRPSSATPSWAWPRAAMTPISPTARQRAQILERVLDVGMALRRQRRGDLTFPPFRTLRRNIACS